MCRRSSQRLLHLLKSQRRKTFFVRTRSNNVLGCRKHWKVVRVGGGNNSSKILMETLQCDDSEFSFDYCGHSLKKVEKT